MKMRDLEKLLHQLDDFQRELESVLKQVTRMEQAKPKQAKKPSLLLRASKLFGFVALSGHASNNGSRSPSPEREMGELLRNTISKCEEMRGGLTGSERPQPLNMGRELYSVKFYNILRYKQLLQVSHTGDDIAALVKDIEGCYSSYQKLWEAINETSDQPPPVESGSVMACPPPLYSYLRPDTEDPDPRYSATVPPPSYYSQFSPGMESFDTRRGSRDALNATEPEPQEPEPITDDVQFRAAAPASLQRDSYAVLKVMMYRGDDYEQADREARRLAKEIKEDASGVFPVQRYQKLTIRIQSEDVQIEEDTQELIWNGRYTCCSFEIFLPADFSKKQVRIKGRVYQGLTVLTDLRLILDVEGSPCEQAVPMERCTLKSAFVSYSHQDKERVLSCIRGISLVCPDMDLFFDYHSLRRGERYEQRILHEIETRDLFYLFWSRHASMSPWVNKELTHALETKDPDCIEPIPLDPPDICPPPQALNDRHFDDWILRYELEQRREQPPDISDYVLRSSDGHEIAIPGKGGIVGSTQLGAEYFSYFRTVSKAHLYIVPHSDGGVFIEDLGSTNGTFLNGQRIYGPVSAPEGSRVTLADVDFSLLKRK